MQNGVPLFGTSNGNHCRNTAERSSGAREAKERAERELKEKASKEPKTDWRGMSAKLPVGKDPASKKKRIGLFLQFDVDGHAKLDRMGNPTGSLSLQEARERNTAERGACAFWWQVDQGMSEFLGVTEGVISPVIHRAFHTASRLADEEAARKDPSKQTAKQRLEDAAKTSQKATAQQKTQEQEGDEEASPEEGRGQENKKERAKGEERTEGKENQGLKGRRGREQQVEFREFRATLVYLRSYLELFQMFDEVDQDDDKMVDLEEFKARARKKQRDETAQH